MNPTTLRTVAEDLSTTIRAITPDYPLFRDKPWTTVPRVADVAGTVLRLYHCEWEAPVPDEVFGTGLGHITTLRVWTNYRGLSDVDGRAQDIHAEIVSADARQLWLALEARQDPVLDGLLLVTPTGWSPESDEPGDLWGSHDFDVRLLLSHN